MIVTDIKHQVKAKGRYSIFIDGKFAFGLSELGLIDSGIKIGQEISTSELEEYKKEAGIDKVYNMALGLIARRPRSKWELEDYLKRKLDDPEAQEQILNKLIKSGYVDDEDFAKRWVENRRLLKQTSKRKLSLELKQKRIPDNVINQVLSDDETDEQEVLKDIISKKRTQTRYQDDVKLMQYLTRQGFNYSDIKRAMSELS